ncbi:hypothetical protein ACQPZ8_49795 [Actinomadura nitritigenes]|uniref:hypothetical protein n=1 Tax=Actinomadura nitritigenes TaxID=134602 RepID=UPI003D8DA66C
MADGTGRVKPDVHVVVTCANRKRQAVAERLQFRNLDVDDFEGRYTEWVKRLSFGSPRVPASQMYAGEHWQVAKTLAETAGPGASLWVCSAGYGLISAEAPIEAYAATFAVGQEDSVAENTEGTRRWWSGLTTWTGPQPGQPRSITELAARNPNSIIVAVLSEAYLRACSDDLSQAASQLKDSDNLSIIGPSGRCREIERLVVPVTAALRPAIGGSLLSLNVRAATHVLAASRDNGIPFRRSHLTRLMAEATAAAPKEVGQRPPGTRLTDDEVRSFIRSSLDLGPTSATRLLRQLRASGQSCEQARFKTLFNDVASSFGIVA